MRIVLARFLRWLPPAGCTVVITAASISPADATSNLAAWCALSGHAAPSWLANPNVDGLVAGSLALVMVIWLIGVFLTRERKPEMVDDKPDSQPKSVGFLMENNIGLTMVDCHSEGFDIGFVGRHNADSKFVNLTANGPRKGAPKDGPI